MKRARANPKMIIIIIIIANELKWHTKHLFLLVLQLSFTSYFIIFLCTYIWLVSIYSVRVVHDRKREREKSTYVYSRRVSPFFVGCVACFVSIFNYSTNWLKHTAKQFSNTRFYILIWFCLFLSEFRRFDHQFCSRSRGMRVWYVFLHIHIFVQHCLIIAIRSNGIDLVAILLLPLVRYIRTARCTFFLLLSLSRSVCFV